MCFVRRSSFDDFGVLADQNRWTESSCRALIVPRCRAKQFRRGRRRIECHHLVVRPVTDERELRLAATLNCRRENKIGILPGANLQPEEIRSRSCILQIVEFDRVYAVRRRRESQTCIAAQCWRRKRPVQLAVLSIREMENWAQFAAEALRFHFNEQRLACLRGKRSSQPSTAADSAVHRDREVCDFSREGPLRQTIYSDDIWL